MMIWALKHATDRAASAQVGAHMTAAGINHRDGATGISKGHDGVPSDSGGKWIAPNLSRAAQEIPGRRLSRESGRDR
jgi:hypothetical protein